MGRMTFSKLRILIATLAVALITVTPALSAGPDAPNRALDTFYGLSHLAVDCMAKKYGEAKMFTFVKLLLTQSDNDLDKAARAAYGLPFGTVDHACAAWIKTQV